MLKFFFTATSAPAKKGQKAAAAMDVEEEEEEPVKTTKKATKAEASNPLAEKVICFTGALTQKRTEATKQAEALGMLLRF